jgi:hypothetical protein
MKTMMTTMAVVTMLVMACGAALACEACGNPSHVPDRVVYDGDRALEGVEICSLGTFTDLVAEAPAAATRATILDPNGRWSLALFKSAESLAALGMGVSYRWTRIGPDNSLYADLAPYYDGAEWGGFGGVSTEASGIPLLGVLIEKVQKAIAAGAARIGVGYGNDGVVVYGAWQF